MPRVSPNYTNFNGGVYSDLIDGRSDLEHWNKGGKEYLNLLTLIYGPFLFRPGSFHVNNAKSNSTKSRLYGHIFNPTDSTVIEIAVGVFRFYTIDGVVGAPLEVSHTYTASELFDVHIIQDNDVVSLFHKDHKPAKLTRASASSWSLADYDFKGNPYLPDNTVSTDLIAASTLTKDATGTLTASGGHTPFNNDMVGTFWKIGEPTGSPEEQGYVKITGFTSTTVVAMKVIKTLSTTTATEDWAEAAWSDFRGWPARGDYDKGRLWVARTDTQPNGAWGSKPFIYDNFDPGTGLDDEGISELVPDAGEIQWIKGGNRLILGSTFGDFIVSGDTSGVVTPETVNISRQTNWGTEAIVPEFIGNYAYAVQLKGRKVREINYLFQEDSYKSRDTTVFAEHITKSGIVQMAYQRNPYSHNYNLLKNGKIAIMGREADQEVLGWTEFQTDGEYESVAVIPHPTKDHDMVWCSVKRTNNGSVERHIEFFESPEIPDRQDLCFYVDDGVRYSAFEVNTGGSLTLSAKTGVGITVTAGSSIFVAGDVGQRIRAIDIVTGEILGELLITQLNSVTEVLGDVVKDFTSLTYAANTWGISVNTVTGFNHLEDKTIKLLVDGGTVADEKVVSGSITLADGDDGFVIAGGLGYTGRWKNMPIEAGSATGTAQGKKKRVYQCGFKFYRSLGMKVGGDEDHLRTLQLRQPKTPMGQAEPLFTGIVAPQKIDSTSNKEGHIVLEQKNPLPMCATGVMPLLATNDKG